MMDKQIFVDYETKICSAYLNAVADTVWDALGQATNPQGARQFIGAIEEAPQNGSSYARQNAQWVQVQVGNLHNDLTGRSAADAHPVSAITGLQASLDQIDLDIAGKAPESAGTASGTSFSPSGTVASTDVQAAIAEVSGDVTALQATVAGLGTPAASAVTFSPTGTVAATNVQAAIAEVASEKVALSGGTMTGSLSGTNFLAPNHQVGTSVTTANNFVLDASADNGTMKIARGNGQDVMLVDDVGRPRFPQLQQDFQSNGYKAIEGGLIIQWGNGTAVGGGIAQALFPIPFPNACLQLTANAGFARPLVYCSMDAGFVAPEPTTTPILP